MSGERAFLERCGRGFFLLRFVHFFVVEESKKFGQKKPYNDSWSTDSGAKIADINMDGRTLPELR